MANEPSSASNGQTSQSPPPPDSYIGSFISVTSKSEIRYEGFIYHLNPHGSVIGLKDVRSYGTEGRARNGQYVPPSDKIYEYILFCGNDIKDLQVKTPPIQSKDLIYNDPAVIQSNNHMELPSSLKSLPVTGGSLTGFNSCSSSALDAQSHRSALPSHSSGTQFWTCGSFPSMHTAASFYGTPTDPAQCPNYNCVPDSITGINQHISPSAAALYPMHYPASPITVTANLLSPPSIGHSTLIHLDGLSMPNSSHENRVVNKTVTHAVSLHLFQSTSPVFDPIPEPLVRQQQSFLTRNISQPKLFELCPERQLYTDQKDGGSMNVASQNVLSPDSIPSVQLNHLSLPTTTQKWQCTPHVNEEFDFQAMNEKLKKDEVWGYLGKSNKMGTAEGIPESGRNDHISHNVYSDLASQIEPKCASQFTEEFDFQAMNEKFKKDEIWEYLGKANHRDKVEAVQENGRSSHVSSDDNADLVSKRQLKPAYNKDDFFDTISGNSISHGARNGQNQTPGRQKSDFETFGNIQSRIQSACNGQRARHGKHRGRDHNFRYRGSGGYKQR